MSEVSTSLPSGRTNNFGLQYAALAVLLGMALFFYFNFAIQYFDYSEEAYGPYFWGKRVALPFHIAGGSLALFMGLPQFWMGLRNRYMHVHRWTGRLYLLGVLVGSIGAFLMATMPNNGISWGFAVGLFGLAVAWVTTTGMAYISIIRRKYLMHKEWMIRSYIVTFAFITFRIFSDYVPYQTWNLDYAQYMTAMMWVSWVFPLLAFEVALQSRKL